MHRWALAGKRHLRSKCRCPTLHNPTNTKQSFMTCPILKRPADCTRPGPSRLSFTPKPRPKQCVGELELPGLPSTARTLFSGLRVSPHGNRRVHWWGFTTLQDGSRQILPPVRLGAMTNKPHKIEQHKINAGENNLKQIDESMDGRYDSSGF